MSGVEKVICDLEPCQLPGWGEIYEIESLKNISIYFYVHGRETVKRDGR